jgi:outer membrane protein TolC
MRARRRSRTSTAWSSTRCAKPRRVKSATESASETHRLYVGGRESFIADLDATRTLTSIRSQVAAAEGQVAIDQANLFLALGGGWESKPQ